MATKLPTVAIIGRANAGKSSLFNRIVGHQQAIVAREAGTTRDNVIARVNYETSSGRVLNDPKAQTDGAFWLVDTAGLKDPNDEFEAGIQDQITEAADAADVILVVVDSSEYPGDEDRIVAKKALKSKKPVILITNKADLKNSLPETEFLRLGIKTIIRTSAEHSSGITDVVEAIIDTIPTKTEKVDDAVLRIALIGRPNVGKSHLFNTLAGKQQALVANVAGTTRDLNRIQLRYNKQTIELIDTAGIRRQGKQERGIEKFSVLRTLQAIEEADVCFLLMDVKELNVALDQKLAGIIADAGKGLVLTVSKWDTVKELQDQEPEEEEEAPEEELSRDEKRRLSKAAKHGQAAPVVKKSFARDALAARISNTFDFVPWAPLIFTSSVTGQNVTKLFDLALSIMDNRAQDIRTRTLNDLLQTAIQKHPPAGLKNTHPKLRYIVHTDTTPPWFVIYGSNLKFVHWSYKRYLERLIREKFNYTGTPMRFSFRDEKQIKYNKERAKQGLEPVTKAYKKALNEKNDVQ